MSALAAVPLGTIEVRRLLPRMGEPRGNVSGYDATYIAAAEAFTCPLITGDARLSRRKVARCTIKVIG